jgi:L-rhamnose mutarotase
MKIAFAMKMKPGCAAEYKKRHDEIWPELSQLLKDNGISDYSIFLEEATNTLFAVQQQSGSSKMVGIHGGYYGNQSR